MKRLFLIIAISCWLFTLTACQAEPTATPRPTEEPLPTTVPTDKPTEEPKATQVPELETSTGNTALDQVISSNLPAGCYEFNVKYTARTDDEGAQLEVFYPITDFWTLLGMIKAGYTSFYAAAPAVFEADPDLEFATFIYQKPADSEKEQVGPQPVVILGISRENAVKVNSDLRWCELVTVAERVEMSPEGAESWSDFCK